MEEYRSRQYEMDYRSRTFENDYGMDIVVPPSRVGQIQPYQPPQTHEVPYGGSYYYKPPSKPKSSKTWGFNDPEVKRKKRVASYKVYTVEGKVKGSFRKGFRWLKDKYTEIVYGWW
eukprot:TRINITY_DN10200_c0_g1_i1.p2 TRINITY_DN10200_c0_g1~~TRINITY_DN10200_c0_g1_i1.p2  ORF type:complete len:116 (-),score=3.21 TRINITY_DN10200_c0_g1_i1:179-526(-)